MKSSFITITNILYISDMCTVSYYVINDYPLLNKVYKK